MNSIQETKINDGRRYCCWFNCDSFAVNNLLNLSLEFITLQRAKFVIKLISNAGTFNQMNRIVDFHSMLKMLHLNAISHFEKIMTLLHILYSHYIYIFKKASLEIFQLTFFFIKSFNVFKMNSTTAARKIYAPVKQQQQNWLLLKILRRSFSIE